MPLEEFQELRLIAYLSGADKDLNLDRAVTKHLNLPALTRNGRSNHHGFGSNGTQLVEDLQCFQAPQKVEKVREG